MSTTFLAACRTATESARWAQFRAECAAYLATRMRP